MKKEEILSIRLRDLQICHVIGKLNSLRDGARVLKLSPSEVSKTLQAVEAKLHVSLFKRLSTGISPTEAGVVFLAAIDRILKETDQLEIFLLESMQRSNQKTIVIASTSFLTNFLVIPEIVKWHSRQSERNEMLRFIDFSPDDLLSAGAAKGYEIALHVEQLKWPSTWKSIKIGSIKWSLCAQFNHKLLAQSNISDVLKEKFVVPAYYDKQGLHTGNDHFCVPIINRLVGATTSTAEAAVSYLVNSDYIAHLPDLLTDFYVREAELKRITIDEMPTCVLDVFLSVHSDSVSQPFYIGIKEAISNALRQPF